MAKIIDKEKRPAELLEKAITVFARRGYQATAMDEIAACAGVSKGMLYLYFKNKETLFGAVFLWFGQMTGMMMQEAISDTDDPATQLQHIGAVWTEVAVKYREYVPLFFSTSGKRPVSGA